MGRRKTPNDSQSEPRGPNAAGRFEPPRLSERAPPNSYDQMRRASEAAGLEWTLPPRRAKAAPAPGTRAGSPLNLAAVLGSTHAAFAAAAQRPIDRELWRQLMGERIASHSQPEQLSEGRLTLLVSSPVWSQELTLLSADLLKRLVDAGFAVRELRCRVGALPKPEARPRARAALPPPAELPPELSASLDAVSDPELRELMRRTIAVDLALASARQVAAEQQRGAAKNKPRRR